VSAEGRRAATPGGQPTSPPAPGDKALRCEGLVQVFGTPGQEVTALRGVDLDVEYGEMVALLGPSGAGKSTLLWVLAGLLRPTAGIVEISGKNLRSLSPRQAGEMRLLDVGIVMQNPSRNLLAHETAMGNVLFAQRPTRRRADAKRRRARALLATVGLEAVAQHRAGRLSGGEQQRLAIAVALANAPRMLLADEPTSQLDGEAAGAVIELIREANQESGTTVIAVTHDPAVGEALGRTVTIRDGRVGAEGRAGVEFVVVGRDGTVQLPPDLLDVLPPGSLAEARRTAEGVALIPVNLEDPT
jgi:putative ABC transport system ATP-binding protein